MEIESKSKKPPPMERRIILLKDFLRDDMSSCSSSGFKSFPRKTCCTYSIRNFLEMDLKSRDPNNNRKLLRSRSKAAATTTTTISAFQKASVAVINVVKCFSSFSSVTSPLSSSSSSKQGILPRSFSKKFRRSFWKKNEKVERDIKVAVRVKDIMRWKSFRDLIEDKQKSLDSCALTLIDQTITTRNSWSDSDFTLESLNSSSGSSNSEYSGETEEVDSNCRKYNLPDKTKKSSKRRSVDDDHDLVVEEEDSMEIKGECPYEKDQFSPISVLDFPSEEDEESSSSSFQSSLANIEKTKQKLMQKIRRFESLGQLDPVNLDTRIASFELNHDSLESPTDTSSSISTTNEENQEQDEDGFISAKEKSRKLLEVLIKETSTTEDHMCKSTDQDLLLLDFFRDEIVERSSSSTKGAAKGGDGDELDEKLLSLAKDWMKGNCGVLDWGFEESRKVHIIEMEKRGNWRSVSEQKGEVAIEMEIMILGLLMDELLLDLSS